MELALHDRIGAQRADRSPERQVIFSALAEYLKIGI